MQIGGLLFLSDNEPLFFIIKPLVQLPADIWCDLVYIGIRRYFFPGAAATQRLLFLCALTLVTVQLTLTDSYVHYGSTVIMLFLNLVISSFIFFIILLAFKFACRVTLRDVHLLTQLNYILNVLLFRVGHLIRFISWPSAVLLPHCSLPKP